MAGMALNHADLTTILAFIFCPIVAGAASLKANAPAWLAVVFVVAGLAVGFALASVIRRVAYAVLLAGHRQTRNPLWPGGLAMLAYVIVAQAILVAGCAGVWFATLWLLMHI